MIRENYYLEQSFKIMKDIRTNGTFGKSDD